MKKYCFYGDFAAGLYMTVARLLESSGHSVLLIDNTLKRVVYGCFNDIARIPFMHSGVTYTVNERIMDMSLYDVVLYVQDRGNICSCKDLDMSFVMHSYSHVDSCEVAKLIVELKKCSPVSMVYYGLPLEKDSVAYISVASGIMGKGVKVFSIDSSLAEVEYVGVIDHNKLGALTVDFLTYILSDCGSEMKLSYLKALATIDNCMKFLTECMVREFAD